VAQESIVQSVVNGMQSLVSFETGGKGTKFVYRLFLVLSRAARVTRIVNGRFHDSILL
jgi:hypothetical protein